MDARPVPRLASVCSAIILLLVTEIPLRGQDTTAVPPSLQDTTAAPLPGPDAALDSLSRAPVYTPFDQPPELIQEQAWRSIEKHFREPIGMRYVGGGSTKVWIFVDTAGMVRNTALLKSSGHKDIDEAALKAAMEFQFTPARFKGEVVPAWITMPVSLKITKTPYQPLPRKPPRDRI